MTTMGRKTLPRRKRAAANGYKLTEDAIDAESFAPFAGVDYFANRSMYDPGETQLVPKGGAWAMIVRELPAIEGRIDEHVTPGRVFFLEHQANADDAGFTPSGAYKVLSHTAWGTIHLWPHEYRVVPVDTILALWQAGSLIFHPTKIDDARLNDITFYARSRGIPLAVAAPMALGSIMAPVGWFECDDETAAYVQMLGRMGGPITSENRRRRAAAHARRTGRPPAPDPLDD